MNNKDLAELIFPEVKETIEDLEKRYPKRNLKAGAEVTRFAPSPTGFLHTGSLFTCLVDMKVAKQSGGIFYTRLEDTDSKREIEGSGKELLEQLKCFDVLPDEGYFGDFEKGDYGPYTQSLRADIYRVVIKECIARGRAYPCFCSKEELDALRLTQEKNHVIPGYYRQYARCRNLSADEAYQKIKNGEPYVIRFRSEGYHERKIEADDLVRGHLLLSENDQDIVIYKSDGLPTYHFAHLVDDHFMRTTIVIRGEEWLSSLPIHLELFQAMNWEAPKYAHLPVIMKLDNGNRRKLSKRKDAEAAISSFLKEGYPKEAILEYLLTIANSNYEEWHSQNKEKNSSDFLFSFDKMSLDGALFDLSKLQNISKELLAKKTKEEIYEDTLSYAQKNDKKLEEILLKNPSYFKEIVNIEREKENPRKDYVKYSEIFEKNAFFYKEEYEKLLKEKPLPFNPFFSKELRDKILKEFALTLNYDVDEQTWFASLKALGVKYGFAENGKIYKANKDSYIGQVGDVAEMIRIALTTSKQSPNLYYVLKVLGKEEVCRRISIILENY